MAKTWSGILGGWLIPPDELIDDVFKNGDYAKSLSQIRESKGIAIPFAKFDQSVDSENVEEGVAINCLFKECMKSLMPDYDKRASKAKIKEDFNISAETVEAECAEFFQRLHERPTAEPSSAKRLKRSPGDTG